MGKKIQEIFQNVFCWKFYPNAKIPVFFFFFLLCFVFCFLWSCFANNLLTDLQCKTTCWFNMQIFARCKSWLYQTRSKIILVNTIITLTIRTPLPYHTCSKIWTSPFYHLMLCLKTSRWMANSVDPVQMPQCSIWSGSTLFAQAHLSKHLG